MLRYLLDEHLLHLAAPLRQQMPELVVWRIGEPAAPVRGTSDADLLIWCETHGFVLVTEDANTMPSALADHLRQGGHLPGIFIVNRGLSRGEAIDLLIYAAYASLSDEHQDQIRYLRSL